MRCAAPTATWARGSWSWWTSSRNCSRCARTSTGDALSSISSWKSPIPRQARRGWSWWACGRTSTRPAPTSPRFARRCRTRRWSSARCRNPNLREAIRYPAQDVGLDVEPGLVEVLLRDLGVATEGYEAGRLPLLAHALRVSWQQRHGATLTVQGYRDTGGIEHAIATTAERTHTALDDDGQRVARWLFRRLIRIGDGTEDIRRRGSLAELVDAAGPDHATVAAVVEAFTGARLLTRQQDSVQITHEALLHSWPRLKGWITTDRVGRLTHQGLEEAATAWDRADRDSSLLFWGSRLNTAQAWADSALPGELSPLGKAFLAACLRARRRAARRRTRLVAVLTVLTAVASTAAFFSFQQQHEAVRQRDLAVYNRVLAEADQLRGSDVSLSAQLHLVAHRIRPGDETATRLVTAASGPLSTPLTGHTDRVTAVAFSPDGRTLVTGGMDKTGSVRVWDVSDPTRPGASGRTRRRPPRRGPLVGLQPGRAHGGHRWSRRGGAVVDRRRLDPSRGVARPVQRGERLAGSG
ncbi:hypothetical protein J7S33_28610, partial [Saccharothrix algeriensis]